MILRAENNFSLGDLFVLDRLFDEGAILDKDTTTLGDLFILDRLFEDSDFITGSDKELSLGELFVLDELFEFIFSVQERIQNNRRATKVSDALFGNSPIDRVVSHLP